MLELLIAMTILGGLVALMAGGLRFGLTVWEKGGALADRTAELTIAQRFIRRQIGEALPLLDAEKAAERVVAFDGRRDSIRFVTGGLAHASIGGPFLVEFALVGQVRGQGLVVRWRELEPDMSDFSDRGDTSSSVLMTEADSATFSYFGRVEGSDETAWQASWNDRRELPMLVRLDIAFASNSVRIWPELVAATHIKSVGIR